MKLIFCKHVVCLFILIFLLSCTISLVEGGNAKPEKIFRHDRDEPVKLSRIDLDNDELQRALQELRQRVPEYTGYLAVDVVFEIFKLLFIFILKLLGGRQPTNVASP